jgi:hypothetical protein
VDWKKGEDRMVKEDREKIRPDHNDLRIRGFHVRIPLIIWISVAQKFLFAEPFGFEKLPRILTSMLA